MFLSTFLSIIGLGFLVYVMFNLAVYALPFVAALTVGMHLYDTDAGVMVAIIVGMFAGVFTLLVGQVVFAKVHSVWLRLLIASLYAAPAGIAGFSAVRGLSKIGGASEGWTLAFAVIGGVIVAGTAWVRVASLAGLPGEDDGRNTPVTQTSPVANDR